MKASTAGRTAVLAAALLLVGGCTPPTAPGPGPSQSPATLVDLRPVALPDQLRPATLVPVGTAVLAAGSRPAGDSTQPAAALIEHGSVRAVTLTATSPYAKVADLFAVAAAGDGRLTALGVAHGGAHANPRWTTWSGTTTSLVEHPQTFGTFGGEEAGVLTGVATTPAGPRIVGSWQGRTALDLAVWRPAGGSWVRLDSADTPLANTATLQVSGRAVAPTATGLVVAGSVLDLGGGVRQSAAVWESTGDRRWRLVRLPDVGARSEASAVRCADGTCLVAGYVDGRLALWSVRDGDATRIADLPDLAYDGDGPAPQLATVTPHPVLAAAAGGAIRLLARSGNGWRTYEGPTGGLVAAAQDADRLFLVTTRTAGTADQRELWSAVPV